MGVSTGLVQHAVERPICHLFRRKEFLLPMSIHPGICAKIVKTVKRARTVIVLSILVPGIESLAWQNGRK